MVILSFEDFTLYKNKTTEKKKILSFTNVNFNSLKHNLLNLIQQAFFIPENYIFLND